MLTFITSNPGKAKQLGYYLDYPVKHFKYDLPEIQSLDVDEIIEHKAREAYKLLQSPVLVEDISFRFNALGKLPGPLIKWFLKELQVEGICKLLNGFEDRSAKGEVRFGLYNEKDFKVFSAEKKGIISLQPRGETEFGGVDTIFIPQGHDKTWGEMTDQEQRKTSMRKIAIKKLQKYLQKDFQE